MNIEYLSHDNKLCMVDLSKEIIKSWEVSTRLGYEPEGSLIIDFEVAPHHNNINSGGVHPPVMKIRNFKNVIDYLTKKHSNKKAR